MKLGQLHRLRQGIQANAPAACRDDVEEMAAVLRDHLLLCGLFETVEVEATDEQDHLLAALCELRAGVDEQDVAARIEALWRHRICYDFWEVHAVLVERGHVEFEAVTRADPHGPYVTLHLIAQRVRIPAQRLPVTEPARTAAVG